MATWWEIRGRAVLRAHSCESLQSQFTHGVFELTAQLTPLWLHKLKQKQDTYTDAINMIPVSVPGQLHNPRPHWARSESRSHCLLIITDMFISKNDYMSRLCHVDHRAASWAELDKRLGFFSGSHHTACLVCVIHFMNSCPQGEPITARRAPTGSAWGGEEPIPRGGALNRWDNIKYVSSAQTFIYVGVTRAWESRGLHALMH